VLDRHNVVLTIPKPGKVVLAEKPYPRIKPGYALIKVFIAPVCAEQHVYEDHIFEAFEDAEHLGHEGVGEIVEVSDASSFSIGDRVIIYQGHPCGECFVCTRGLSPSHCLKLPEEVLRRGTHPHEPIKDIGGAHAIDSPGGMKVISDVCGSQSGSHGFSRYRIAPENMLQKIPGNLAYRYAAAANCSCGCIFSAMEELEVKGGDWLLIAGVGFLGFGAIINAKSRNARVIVLGRNEYRMGVAERLGADCILNPDESDWLMKVHRLTGDLGGVDACIECSGHPFYQEKCIEAVRRYGKIYFTGAMLGSDARLSMDVHDQVMIKHTWMTGGLDVRFKDREGLLSMLQNPHVQENIDTMVTHEFPMSAAKEAFEVALSRNSGKIYLYPWE
jgi:threonine dehydrogenase-like Zn-dependent dehydrogenase